jgi:hypothetical protein
MHRSGQTLRVDKFTGLGEILAERLHERTHRLELAGGPGEPVACLLARDGVEVPLRAVHHDDVFHVAAFLSRLTGTSNPARETGHPETP